MRREFPGLAKSVTQGDALRLRVQDAPDDRARLAALLALARYYVDVADGVRGLSAAGEARALALAQRDTAALADALNSASVSQYHRSDYVSAIATAVDAWDAATRVGSVREITLAHVSIGLALLALEANGMAEKVVDKGLVLAADKDALRVPRIRLLRLKAMIVYARDEMSLADELLGQALRLAEEGAPSQLAASHGNWGIALLRRAERFVLAGKPAHELLRQARHHFEEALRISEQNGDALGATDRIAALGAVHFFEGQPEEAERLLGAAMDRARELDYVRTAVISSFYLARIYMQRGVLARARSVLRHAISQARRGAAEDYLAVAHSLQADVLEQEGLVGEAAELRAAAKKYRDENEVFRRRAAEDAVRQAARVLGA